MESYWNITVLISPHHILGTKKADFQRVNMIELVLRFLDMLSSPKILQC